MSIQTLAELAIEQSTYVVTASFTDEDDEAVVPNTLTWTLEDDEGTVVNDRDSVAITPASSVEIVLSGDDLNTGTTERLTRILTLEGTYNSDLGINLPIRGQVRIVIEDWL